MEYTHGLILAAIVLVIGGFLMWSSHNDTEDITVNTDASSDAYNTAADGTKYTIHPDELILGCSGKDCIPSIDDPSFESVDAVDEWLQEGDLVIGIERNGESKAYPLRILNVHEIVNDEVGGDPVAVTYCPLCRSGLAYSREVNNQTLDFGVSGRLYNANLVMYDRQTETFWSQVQGDAIVGPLVPTELDLVFSTITEWSKWRDAHPNTQVLSRDTGIYPVSTYDRNPYSGYFASDRVGFGVNEVDDRLHPKAIVYGVTVGGAATAYPEDAVENESIIHDTVGDTPVIVIQHPDTGAVHAYRSEEELMLRWESDALVDADGNEWQITDDTLKHVDSETALDAVPTHGFFWFAWSAFHPETSVYGEGY